MGRISLRPPSSCDAEAIDGWLPEAVSAVSGRTPAHVDKAGGFAGHLARLDPKQEALVVALRERPVGLLVWSHAGPEMVAIHFLAIAEAKRNLGLGAEAVLELEARHRGKVTFAGVPLANGLAIYFWLRIGYRPIYPRPLPVGLPAGGIWLFRPGVVE